MVAADETLTSGFSEKPVSKLSKSFVPSDNLADWGVVAKDDNLSAVFDHMIAASTDFGFENLPSNGSLDVPAFTPHDTAFTSGFGFEDLLHPKLGREKADLFGHPLTLSQLG
ncbi:hypothetical protein [Aliiroseovarius sp. PrR006]|uniref:hypothetical protein n=1 Tax=Aliiroseovarius sp. PrR006 TaxID=2706883 RepID=UPI0013D209FC|nr:hypothetical protein [Aliiroseovarius sp. PrR006]